MKLTSQIFYLIMQILSACRMPQLHTAAQTRNQMATGRLALVENPRDPMRGFFYWGYFYFTYTNTAPFQAEGTVLPG